MSSTVSADMWNSLSLTYGALTLVLIINYKAALFARVLSDFSEQRNSLSDGGNGKEYVNLTGYSIRINMLHNDNVENMPMDMVVLWAAYILLQWQNASGVSGDIETLVLLIAFCLYAASRLIITACYMFRLIQFRYIVTTLGNVAIVLAAAIMVDSATQINFKNVFRYIN